MLQPTYQNNMLINSLFEYFLVWSYSISWNKSQLRPVLQEHVTCTLLRVDTNTIVGNNRTSLGWNFELKDERRRRRRRRKKKIRRRTQVSSGLISKEIHWRENEDKCEWWGWQPTYLFCSILENSSKWCLLRHAKDSVRKLRVRSESYLERDFRPGRKEGEREFLLFLFFPNFNSKVKNEISGSAIS